MFLPERFEKAELGRPFLQLSGASAASGSLESLRTLRLLHPARTAAGGDCWDVREHMIEEPRFVRLVRPPGGEDRLCSVRSLWNDGS